MTLNTYKKLLKNLILIFVLFYSNYSFSLNHIQNYNCILNLSTNIKNISPLEMSAPRSIKISYNSKNNNLINYIWDNKSVIKDFELINNVNSEFIEIARKGFKKNLLSQNVRNGIFLKLYLNKQSANLNKQFIKPIKYQCTKNL